MTAPASIHDDLTGTVLVGARVVTPSGVLPAGWVQTSGRHIAAVGTGPLPDGVVHDLAGGWLLPGFVDLHMHGGGGHDVTASPDAMAAAVEFHRGHGTAATLISLVTAPVQSLCEQLSWVADLAERDPHVLGAHLEGPFLAPSRCGAQHPDHLLRPDHDVLSQLVDAARGHLRCVTIAPELPGALDLIDDLLAIGIVVAVGHTDATYDEARAAFDRGATLATHLYNGMRPVHHREPGPVLAALDSDAWCEVINDGVHVHPAVVTEVLARGTERLVWVTDAISAAGAAPGRYLLGGLDVEMRDGEARLRSSGALAGSVLTLDDAVRRAVHDGTDIVSASRAASGNPAAVVDLTGRTGAIEPGLRADLVLLGEDLRVRKVMSDGSWNEERRS
ncbi:N-acetylglucosamine-6-phosphate deacetylase [Nocardioides sp. DS6]|uniref:N-acetylglucosamine-6-phosphate deacetylase n=1 Tax=Nocardioides eburneus TaxID=3231482 RepID=A0ABV3SZD6_9ACTN